MTFFVYLSFLLPFLTSFCFAEGILNDNSYIKQFAVGITVSVQGITCLIMAWPWKKIRYQYNSVDVLVTALFILYLLFFVGTKNFIDFSTPFLYFFYYFFLRLFLQNSLFDIRDIMFKIIPFILSVHYLIVLFQYLHLIPNLHSFFPIGSTFGNPDKFGSYISILLAIISFKDNKKKIDYVLVIVGILILIALQARTSIIALSVALIYNQIVDRKISKKILWTGLVVFIFGLSFLVLWHPASVSGRIFIWIVAMKMFINKLQGHGMYAFQKDYMEQQTDFIEQNPGFSSLFNIDQVSSPFNDFLYIGVSFGIVGFLLYLSLLISLLVFSYRNKSIYTYPLIVFIIISLSYFPLKIAPIAVVMVMLAAIVATSYPALLFKIKIRVYVIPALIVLTVVSTGINVFNYKTFKVWRKAIDKSCDDSELSQRKAFLQIYPYLKGNGLFLFSYADYEYQKGNLHEAIKLMEDANKYHTNVELINFSSFLYEENNEIEKAEEYLRKAMKLSNYQYHPTYNLILFLIRTGKEDEAYHLSLDLYHREIDSSYYIDVKIIRSRLKQYIDTYKMKRSHINCQHVTKNKSI